jgi:putative ABC transport system substrate-binding protein
MKRRDALTLLGYSLLGAAVQQSSFAQSARVPVVGFLNGSSAVGYAPMVTAFREGLKELGFVDGHNVHIEFLWADGHYDRLREMASDFVGRPVSVIVANTPANLVAKGITAKIPIVFTTSSDPVAVGLVDSMSRPSGNITGVSQLNVEVGPKRLELAHQLVPTARSLGLLVNPDNPQHDAIVQAAKAGAQDLGVDLQVLYASTEAQIEEVFANFSELKSGALTIGTDAFFNGQTERLARLGLTHKVPTVYQYHQFSAAGGLISYGGSIRDSYRLAGIYAGRVLKGEKPVDLPVQQSTRVELIINLQTARTLGLQVPPDLVARADEIIE